MQLATGWSVIPELLHHGASKQAVGASIGSPVVAGHWETLVYIIFWGAFCPHQVVTCVTSGYCVNSRDGELRNAELAIES